MGHGNPYNNLESFCINACSLGHVSRAVMTSCQLMAPAEGIRVQSQDNSCTTYGGQSGAGVGLYPNIQFSPCKYYSATASFSHLLAGANIMGPTYDPTSMGLPLCHTRVAGKIPKVLCAQMCVLTDSTELSPS
jgi:hypothetical protein